MILQPTAEGGMEIVTASTPEDPDGIVGATITPAARSWNNCSAGNPSSSPTRRPIRA